MRTIPLAFGLFILLSTATVTHTENIKSAAVDASWNNVRVEVLAEYAVSSSAKKLEDRVLFEVLICGVRGKPGACVMVHEVMRAPSGAVKLSRHVIVPGLEKLLVDERTLSMKLHGIQVTAVIEKPGTWKNVGKNPVVTFTEVRKVK